jgi:predicted ATP-grasp superfamily ATP-dependent carboligase
LLGPSAASIRLTADKYALGQHLQSNGVPTPDCFLPTPGFLTSIPRQEKQISNIEQGITKVEVSGTSKFDIPCSTFDISSSSPLTGGVSKFPLVLKPRFGAGSLETFLIQGPVDRPGFQDEGRRKDMIVQRFVAGQPASVAILIGSNQRLAMPAASQVLSADGRFHYLGGCIPLPEKLTVRAHRLACQAIESVPGFHGYVGVDLVLGSSPDGSEDWVIEINPRLTTSYIGLRARAESNLAEAMLNIAGGKEVEPLKWRQGTVHFHSDGRVIRR